MKKKLHFVDDDLNVLASLRRLLNGHRQEWDMTFATSVDDALKRICETIWMLWLQISLCQERMVSIY